VTTVEGILIRIEPRVWWVATPERDVPCSLKPKLFETLTDEKNPVAVGDRVLVALEGERGTIEERLPRRNRLARPTPSDPRVIQVTAANIDLLVDRFLVAAERNAMDAAIVVNKCDRGDRGEIEERLALYREMGYPLLFTSAVTREGIAELEALLANRTSLFVGHSGVGKSSLLNAIDPNLKLRTGVVAKHGRGRHTTTSVSLWRLPKGGFVVDSPGIRGFGIAGIPRGELAILMPDLRPHAVDCRYPDCSHAHEPDCGVRRALEAGLVRPERYESYLRILESLDGARDDDE
jgi:ribosome biogenesis GTPase / thiamine phosphate phosphatase